MPIGDDLMSKIINNLFTLFTSIKDVPLKAQRVRSYIKRYGKAICIYDKNDKWQMFNYRGYLCKFLNKDASLTNRNLKFQELITILDFHFYHLFHPNSEYRDDKFKYISEEEIVYHIKWMARHKQSNHWKELRLMLKEAKQSWDYNQGGK